MRKHLFIFLIFILPCLSSTGQRGVSYKETKKENLSQNFKNILILAVGSTVSRVFLDDLGEKLILLFEKNKVNASYEYLGKEKEETIKNYLKISFKKRDVVLIIYPNEKTYFEVINEVTQTYSHGIMSTNVNSRPIYQQEFSFILLKAEDRSSPFWSAHIDVTAELGGPRLCKLIAKRIVERFRQNQYIQ